MAELLVFVSFAFYAAIALFLFKILNDALGALKDIGKGLHAIADALRNRVSEQPDRDAA